MMANTFRMSCPAGVLMALLILFSGAPTSAQPAVQLRLDPDIRTIIVGKLSQPIKITTLTNKPGVRFAWDMKGEGKLEEKIPNSGALYTPPITLAEKSQTVISVSVTDEKGRKAEDKVTFTLIPTPETVKEGTAPGKDNTLEDLLRKADALFKREQYLTPPEENAFDLYTAVLRIAPQNEHARMKIQEMMRDYKERGDKYYESRQNASRAKDSYEKYLTIAEYLNSHEAFEEVTNRLKILTLLKEAEAAFDPNRFNFLPKAEYFETYKSNIRKALSYYRDVLAVDAQHKYAQSKIEQIITINIKWGDYAYQRQMFITPPGRSAFDYYQLVLQIDPQQQAVREKMLAITENYKKRGDKEYQRKKYADAQKWYERYLDVANYVVNELQEQRIASEYQEVQRLLAELSALNPPSAEPDRN